MNLLAQTVGAIALLFVVLSFQHKTRKGILVFVGIGCTLFAIHYMLLGAATGAMLNILVVLQSILFSHFESKKRPKWPLITMIIGYTIVAVVTWQGPLSIFPTLGTIFGSLSFWQRDPQRVRWWAISARPLWFVYNFASGSIAGVIAELLNFSSIVVGLWRYRKPGKRSKTVQDTV